MMIHFWIEMLREGGAISRNDETESCFVIEGRLVTTDFAMPLTVDCLLQMSAIAQHC